MEKFIKDKLINNQIDKMLFLIFFCVVIIFFNSIKIKKNNKDTIELLSVISEL